MNTHNPLRRQLWLLAATLALLGLGCQHGSPPAPLDLEKTEQLTAVIDHIDRERRLVSLRTQDGGQLTVEAGPEVRNFDQLQVGDQVVTTYYEAIAAELRQRGKGDQQAEAPAEAVYALRSAPGERPGIAAGRVATVGIVIDSVDPSFHTITFTDATGMTRVIGVDDPAAQQFIAKLKKGDVVDVTYSEALAISVEPVKAP
jgi:hypothetical protein